MALRPPAALPMRGKLFLIDAMALVYRAHFAFRKFPRYARELDTGAIYGFTNTLVEVLHKEKPSHIAVAFDTAAPTFRHHEYEAYKAHREKQPEAIEHGLPWVKKILQAFHIPVLEQDGYEADDIIGTLVKHTRNEQLETYMMTPDKDYAQLVGPHVFLYRPGVGKNPASVWNEQVVCARFGIQHVAQVIDILGLQGDAVDNIPGIPGIGPKTAMTLLKAYGSLENIVSHAADLPKKLAETVTTYAAQGLLSKKLATIHTDVPLTWTLEDCVHQPPDQQALGALFSHLEFKSLAKRVLGSPSASPQTETLFSPTEPATSTPIPPMPSSDIPLPTPIYHQVETLSAAQALAACLAEQEAFAMYVLRDHARPMQAVLQGMAFAYTALEAYYIPFSAENRTDMLACFHEVLADKRIRKISHDIKNDLLLLRRYHTALCAPFSDTTLAHYLIDPEARHDVLSLVKQYIPAECIETLLLAQHTKTDTKKNTKTESPPTPAQLAHSAAEHARVLFLLEKKLYEVLSQDTRVSLYREVELPLLCVLAEMEWVGVHVDSTVLQDLSRRYQEAALALEKQILQTAGYAFNLASPKQLGEALFAPERLHLLENPAKTRTGLYATGEEVLAMLAPSFPVVAQVLEYREYQKLRSTYLDALPRFLLPHDKRIHPEYRQTVAATGRLSANHPNVQSIPIRTHKGRAIRQAFGVHKEHHVILSADYSQIELRIVAAFSGDKAMLSAFQQGQDIHVMTASRIFHTAEEQVNDNMRRVAKSANFGIMYGISSFGLAQNLKVPRSEAKAIIDAYYSAFSGVKTYINATIKKAREQGYVETLLGRRRYLRDIRSRNATQRHYAERNAINAPIQGSAADLIKLAMLKVHTWLQTEKLHARLIMQVHDELVFEVPAPELALLQQQIPVLMRTAYSLSVPLEVSVGTGQNWLEAH